MESKMAGLAQAPEPSEKLLGVEVQPMFVKNVGFYRETMGNWGFQIFLIRWRFRASQVYVRENPVDLRKEGFGVQDIKV